MRTIKKVASHIFIDGFGGMTQGLFATLIIGTMIQQIGLLIGGSTGNVIYLLGKGENSREMSYYSFNTFLDQSNQIRSKLEDWHKNQVNSLGIDMDKKNEKSEKNLTSNSQKKCTPKKAQKTRAFY